MRFRRLIAQAAALALGLATLLPALPAAAQDGTKVRTDKGWVSGASAEEFLGIPYAAPPVGALRWQPPRPHAPWAGTRDATAYGNSCVQGASWDPGYETPKLTEDCLYLNVYRPDKAPHNAPVFVWIHGGGFTGGAGRDVVPTEFARKGNVIAVTVNYRLGAMGFLSHPSLGGDSGDYGLMDQQAALRWVRRNIASFGGDPAKVTIAGESAGGQSVCDQLASPTAAGLFRGAIIESGSYGDCAMTPAKTPTRTARRSRRSSAVPTPPACAASRPSRSSTRRAASSGIRSSAARCCRSARRTRSPRAPTTGSR